MSKGEPEKKSALRKRAHSFCRESRTFFVEARKLVQYTEDAAEHTPFFCYWPQYSAMDEAQRKWYFYLRGCIRRDEYPETDPSYLFVYVYEILNLIGVQDATEGYRKLLKIQSVYGEKYPSLRNHLNTWIYDYTHVYDCGITLEQLLSDLPELPERGLNELLLKMSAGDAFEIPLWALERLSGYKITKSKFYQHDNQDLINRCIPGVLSDVGGRKLNLAMQHYTLSNDPGNREKAIQQLNSYLYGQVRGQKCLVFTNGRMESELTASALTELAAQRKETECFYVHHGSVSKALREEAEAALKNDERAATAIATRTLELGIDLGGLDRVIQLGAPNTCSSFVQRLGRTGRRGAPAVMRFITRNQAEGESEFDDLPWELIQNIAIVQLYLEDRWVEPFSQKRCPYSVLFHQCLSALMQKEQTPRELARSILTMPAFERVPPSDGLELLKHMLSQDIVEKTEQGGLIPGLKGERLANHYSFLSVFADDAGWRVIHMQREIGEIDAMPEQNAIIVLAGKCWRVSEIDAQRKKAYVLPAKGKAKNNWSGGSVEVHDRIVRRMRKVLIEDAIYPYLLPEAVNALRSAREWIAKLDLQAYDTVVGGQEILLHPWLGTRKMQTLLYLLKNTLKEELKVQSVSPARSGMALHIVSEIPAKRFMDAFVERIRGVDEQSLMADAAPVIYDRYDPFVPEALLKKAFVYDHLDIPGIREWANRS